MIPETCARCNALFECKPYAIAECHCSKIELSAEETQFISAQFDNCLCNTCLLELKAQYHTGTRPKAIFSWSGGKDSAYCLHQVLSTHVFDVKYLLTSVNSNFKRVSMHGVREELLEQQANSIGIPLLKVEVSEGTNVEYEKQMEALLLKAKSEGIEYVIFGDIFLEDLRAYREANLAKVGMKAVFPIWKRDTTELVQQFISENFKTITCCVNDGYLGEEWLGKEINTTFLQQLPAHVDPCGEQGEYHSFCYSGPIFKKKIEFTTGEKIYKALDLKLTDDSGTAPVVTTKGFWFIDLLPV